MDNIRHHISIGLCVAIATVAHCSYEIVYRHECKGAIGISNYSFTGASISLLANDSAWKTLKTKTSNCTYVFRFLHNRYIAQIAVPTLLSSTICDTSYSKINIIAGLEGKPVKSVGCRDSGRWMLDWPFNRLTVEILLSNNTSGPFPQFHQSSFVIMNISTISNFRSIPENTLLKKILLPSKYKIMPRYVLGCAGYYFHVRYEYRPFVNVHDRKVEFLLNHLPVCIKVHFPFDYWTLKVKCKWKVHLTVRNKTLMVLNCESIVRYWCLPESWTQLHDRLQIKFVSDGGRITNEYYDVFITSNDTTSPHCALSILQIPLPATTDNGQFIVTVVTVCIIAILSFLCATALAVIYLKRRNSQQRNRSDGRELTRPLNSSTNEHAGNSAYRLHSWRANRHVGNVSQDQDRFHNIADPPPDYAVVTASTDGTRDPSTSEMPHRISTNLSPEPPPPSEHPPPSYDEALDMIKDQNVHHVTSREPENVHHDSDNNLIDSSNHVSYTPPGNHGNC